MLLAPQKWVSTLIDGQMDTYFFLPQMWTSFKTDLKIDHMVSIVVMDAPLTHTTLFSSLDNSKYLKYIYY